MKVKDDQMRTTLIGRWSEKNSKTFVALLAAGATLAIAMLVDASSSHQVEQLGQMAIHRSAHKTRRFPMVAR